MKIGYTVVSGLILAVTIGLFNYGDRINSLEAKVPTGCNTRLTALETQVPAIKETHKANNKSIVSELTYIRGRLDNIYTLLTKHN